MILNSEQLEAVRLAAKAPCGILLINGCPGSGKSHVAFEMMVPHLMSKKRPNTVIMMAASNDTTDNLARGVSALYKRLVKKKLAEPGQRILRLHSPGAERSIKLRDIRQQQEEDPRSRPEVERCGPCFIVLLGCSIAMHL